MYFISDPTVDTAGAAIENIADAVTHARFVGTDPSSDEVILMKILHVSVHLGCVSPVRYIGSCPFHCQQQQKA